MTVSMVVVFMALLVMLGTVAGNRAVVQIHPEFAPMQFNTALGFLLAGLTLMPMLSSHRRVRMGLGAFLLFIGLATLSQYIFESDFGIDNFFVDPVTVVRTSHAGRMAPNTAICFTLSGLAILMGAWGQRSLSGCVGAAVLGGGLVSLLGYVSGVEAAYGWGDLTRMAIHTSVGFVLLGGGLALHALDRWNEFLQKPLFTSGTVAVLVLTITIGAWQALAAERRRDIMAELKNVADQSARFVGYRMEDVFDALERLARRSASDATDDAARHWDGDSDAYLEHIPALRAVAWYLPEGDALLKVRAANDVPTMVKVMQGAAARAESSVVPDRFQVQFEKAPADQASMLIATLSVSLSSGVGGVFVALLDTEKAFLPILEGQASTIVYRISDSNGLLFETSEPADSQADKHYQMAATFPFFGEELVLNVIGTNTFIQSRASRAAYVVLIGGFIMSLLLIVTIQLALFSWRTREAYRHEYAQYRLVAKHVPAMIAAFDEKERVIFASPPLLKWLGLEEEAPVIGQMATDVFGPYFSQIQPRLALALHGDYENFELEYHSPKGLPQHFDVQLVPHVEPDGTVLSVYALMRDTTEEKLANLRLAIGREETMIGLKREVNQLLESAGRDRRYRIAGIDDIKTEMDI